jgi:hypothetical protein|tara:strand:+ start:721 stop:936 length:216 start_codon:yes stop_codon:yes gene_type:complete
MHVELTARQKEYVQNYQHILHRIKDVQDQLTALHVESGDLIKDLKELREAESKEFPTEESVLIEQVKETDK